MSTNYSLSLLAGLALMPLSGTLIASPAQNPTPTPSSTNETQAPETIGRDVWLGKMQAVAPGMICNNFSNEPQIGKVMKSKNMTVDQCTSLITPITEKCINQLRNSIPDPIGEEAAGIWGRKIGECIGSDFAVNHLYNPSTPETNAPAPSSSPSTTEPPAPTTDTPKAP